MSVACPIMRLEKAWKSWRGSSFKIDILQDINLSVYPGTFLAIVGPSGAGKSTLLHVLGMLTPLDSGALFFNERRVSSLKRWRDHDARREIGYVFQDAKLIANLNVIENVSVPLAHRGIWPRQQKRLAAEALERVGLKERMSHRPSQLSGGEIMRVAIARALVLRPRVLLADEPTGTLDSKTGEIIADLLMETVTQDRALVIVTHEESLARRAHRIITMKDGRFEPA